VIVAVKKSFLITSYDKQANTSQKVLEYLISHLVLFQAVTSGNKVFNSLILNFIFKR